MLQALFRVKIWKILSWETGCLSKIKIRHCGRIFAIGSASWAKDFLMLRSCVCANSLGSMPSLHIILKAISLFRGEPFGWTNGLAVAASNERCVEEFQLQQPGFGNIRCRAAGFIFREHGMMQCDRHLLEGKADSILYPNNRRILLRRALRLNHSPRADLFFR